MLADEIKKYNTAELINFLYKKDLELNKDGLGNCLQLLVVNSLESIHNEYVSTILHTFLHITGDLMEEKFNMRPEFEIIGEESSGRADYEIKEVKSRIKELEEK
ncbi:hypothetical protein RhiirB3_449018 [Rhizophagus irregularis]|nr:hypothetical protein RhiirB3_449018 [Rhizophagus irregularis]